MTAFLLFDELERDFEALEEHPARHAAAVAMYCLIGQRCAQRMTDGAVSQTMIAKAFAIWPKAMVATTIADLIALGFWRESADGFEVVDWDLKQTTKEQETRRRELQNERQRKRRQPRTVEETGTVTRDAHRDEPRDVTQVVTSAVTLPSSSSSSSDPPPHPPLATLVNARADLGEDPPFPTDPDRFTKTRALVRQQFAQRFHAANPKAGLWTQATSPDTDLLTRWLLSLPEGDPEANLERTLDVFFADEYVISKHFPIGHLARNAHKYFEPRETPERPGLSRRTSKQARAEARAASMARDDAAVKRLVAEAKELEDAEERAARGYRARA